MNDGKKARLRELLASQGTGTPVPLIERRDLATTTHPLSFSQQGLWFVSQLEGPNSAYNNSIIVRICGSLNVEALNRAINFVVKRHSALRTRFVESDGIPSQICEDFEEI